ncbi:MAG: thiol-disulfide isomerase/thioredoxin [Myxococcota bacterium]|jgi:thiol-disulfide isomerase/thioredoxin
MLWLAAAALSVAVAEDALLAVGDEAPRIVLQLPDGTLLDSEDLLGTPHVIDFWSPHCGPCRGMVPALNAAQDRLEEVGGAVLGRTMTALSPTIAAEWGIDYAVGTPMMPGQVDQGELYKVTRLPASFVVGADGRIAAAFYRMPSQPQLIEAVEAAVAGGQ